MAIRNWIGGTATWDTTNTANWAADGSLMTASCSGTTLTTTGSPALVVGMTVRLRAGGTSLGTIVSGANPTWTVSVGGTHASQGMVFGTAGASVPTTADAAFLSFFTGVTVTLSGSLDIQSFHCTGGFASTIAGTGTLTVSGGTFAVLSGCTWSATGLITFTGSPTVTTNGVTISAPITHNAAGGTMTLAGALTLATTRTFTLTQGTVNLVSYTLTTGFFSSSNSNTRVIAFGTGNITVNGAGGTLWTTATTTSLTTTGTPVVNVSYSGATATTITPGALNEANSISFNFTAGTYSLTMTAGNWRNLSFAGFAGTVGNTANTIYGNLTLALAATYTSSINAWTFAATSTGKTITTNGETVTFPLIFNGVGGAWALQDALTMGATRSLTHTNGTLDLNGRTLTVGTQYVTATGTKNLTFNGGTLVCPSATATAFNNAQPTNFTTTAGTGTGTISMTAATAKTFVGGGSTFNCTINQGGAGALTITGANTFNDITDTVQPATVTFPASTTTTFVSGFSLSGTSGNLITINSSSAGVQATLSKASGTVSVSFCAIKDIAAAGGATWTSFTSNGCVDNGNNTGWLFSPNVSVSVTGQSASVSVGVGTVVAMATAPPTGVEATGSVGTLTVQGKGSVTLTGVEATGSTGTLTASGIATVDVTGIEAEVIDDGVGVSAGGSISVDPNDVLGTGAVGTVGITATANVLPTGVEATGETGTVDARSINRIPVTGVEGIGETGTVDVSAGITFSTSGVAANCNIGTAEATASANAISTGVSATGDTGTVTTTAGSSIEPDGVSATGSTGTATTAGGSNVVVLGVQAVGSITTPLIWMQINDNQTPNWVAIDDSQTVTWAQVNDGNTVTWVQIPA